MKHFCLLLVPIFAGGLVSCTTAGANRERCAARSLYEIEADPLNFIGKEFCGDVLLKRVRKTVRILHSDETQPSDDVALIVTAQSARIVISASDIPQQFFVRARIEPQIDCFRALAPDSAPDNGETCVPYRRPIFFHLIEAKAK